MLPRALKILKSYSRLTGKPLRLVKLEYDDTPKKHRMAVLETMESGLWSCELRDWRVRHMLLQKEAWDILAIPEDTYRSWESMRKTPHKLVMESVRRKMEAYKPNPATPC